MQVTKQLAEAEGAGIGQCWKAGISKKQLHWAEVDRKAFGRSILSEFDWLCGWAVCRQPIEDVCNVQI